MISLAQELDAREADARMRLAILYDRSRMLEIELSEVRKILRVVFGRKP